MRRTVSGRRAPSTRRDPGSPDRHGEAAGGLYAAADGIGTLRLLASAPKVDHGARRNPP